MHKSFFCIVDNLLAVFLRFANRVEQGVFYTP